MQRLPFARNKNSANRGSPDKKGFAAAARKLAGLFIENFKKFESGATPEVKAAGPSGLTRSADAETGPTPDGEVCNRRMYRDRKI